MISNSHLPASVGHVEGKNLRWDCFLLPPNNKLRWGLVEGLDNKIRVIERCAFGIRKEDSIRFKIRDATLSALQTDPKSSTRLGQDPPKAIARMASLQRSANALVGWKRARAILVVVLALAGALAGCANLHYQQPLNTTAAADSSKGYLYGRFNLDTDSLYRVWIRMENVDTQRTFEMPFQDVADPPYVIAVEPGTYGIKEFVVTPAGPSFTHLESEVEKMPIPTKIYFISQPVQVDARTGYYLGDFFAMFKTIGLLWTPLFVIIRTQNDILQFRQNFDVTTKLLKERYTGLTNVEMQPAFRNGE